MVREQWHVQWAVEPKEGNTTDECEDKKGVLVEGKGSRAAFFAVVSDGATEGLLNGRWADTIVTRLASTPVVLDAKSVLRALDECQSSWTDKVAAYRAEREAGNRPIRWYEEPGLESGSFATLLYVVARPIPLARPTDKHGRHDIPGSRVPTRYKWQAYAVGDSCLFEVSRTEELRSSFPLTRSREFGTSPALLRSQKGQAVSQLQEKSGVAEPGDRLYLMTDALSCWFLKEVEAGRRPWSRLDRNITTSSDFKALCQRLRATHAMRNDDTSVVRIVF